GLVGSVIDERRVHLEARAAAALGPDGDVSVALVKDRRNDRHAQAGATTRFLGRVKRLEQSRQRDRVHPTAGIADCEPGVSAGGGGALSGAENPLPGLPAPPGAGATPP